MGRARLIVTFSLVFVLIAGGDDSIAGENKDGKTASLPEGTWAGPGVSLSIKKESGVVEFDCGHGTIRQTAGIDETGRFQWKGNYESETGGPSSALVAPPDGTSVSPSKQNATIDNARYKGVVKGEEMTLTVTLVESGAVIGTFHLRLGQTPRLRKCR
jgi:hypothetical protein